MVIFLDLAKAFGSIDRTVLLNKLDFIGVRGASLNWFRRYITGRDQIVNICGVNSDVSQVNYGVIQGSTLGPVLFLIYINNIIRLNTASRLLLFADDAAVLVKGKNWIDAYNIATRDLKIIKIWLDKKFLTSKNQNTCQYI